MKLILSICLLTVSSALFGQQKEFNWLIGTWQDAKYSFEVWKDEGGFLSATAYQIDHQSGNKNVNEEIKLIKKGNDFYYVPDVAGPQGPIEFKITSFDKNSFTAENPSHDFPKKIIYKKINEQQLEATISGGSKSISYAFKKIK
ncbi:MAG TPA: DUF6265 family protein [Cyclobacteriaceae bacterium]|jgi:hypothetical protein|nr:DUF6265 family protein [Cyclobacteriaceae bacterium]